MADSAVKRETDSVEADELTQKAKKKARVDDENGGGEAGNESENVLCGFKTSNVLNDSAREKNIFIHGKVTLGNFTQS